MPDNNHIDAVTLCESKVKEAEAAAYAARCEAIGTIIDGAEPWEIMSLFSWYLGGVMSDMCDEHRDEIRADLMGMIDSATEEHDRIMDEIEDDEADEQTKH